MREAKPNPYGITHVQVTDMIDGETIEDSLISRAYHITRRLYQ